MFRRLVCFVLGCMVVVSCSQEPTVTVITMPTSPTAYGQVTRSPMPSSTTLPTTAPSLTATSILPKLEKTLTPLNEDEKIVRLFKEPVCNFPCWWDIVPGATTWDDAKHLFDFLGFSTENEPIGLYTNHEFVMEFSDSIYKMRVQVYDKSGIVEYIAIRSFLQKDDFRELYLNYEPTKVLENYGVPDRIFVTASLLGDTNYGLAMFYDKQGFLISYGGQIQSVTDMGIVICPHFSTGNILGGNIFMQAQSIKTPIESSPIVGLREEFSIMKSQYNTIEDATGLTREQFSSLFVGDDPSYCFTISK